jgi:hypothetical protein
VKGPARLLVILVLPLIIGKVLEVFLSSGPGRKVAEKAGVAELSTAEGVEVAKKYAAAGSAAIGTAATALAGRVQQTPHAVPNPKNLSYAAVAADTAELLLATGALVKVVGDFIRDREELKVKTLGGALRR